MELNELGAACRGNVKILIDVSDYYKELAKAIRQARDEILILGWDINGGIFLERSHDRPHATLRQILDDALKSNSDLHVRVLSWDYSPLFSLERDNLQSVSQGWLFHSRIHFLFDDHHPIGASHHQKIVVIDGSIGFVGGADLSISRWDTSDHTCDNPERINPNGKRYPPFHDVQAQVDGEVAYELRKIANCRWQDLTGSPLADLKCTEKPYIVDPDFKGVRCQLVQTLPPLGLRSAVRDVELSYRAMINSAKRFIYIENQYLTSDRITSCLEKRISDPNGPNITIILPKRAGGWLEQHTMGHLQDNCIARLRQADQHKRLRIFYPDNRKFEDDEYLTVHSKVTIVDGSVARIGSSNLNDRSLGVDTECDLLIVASNHEERKSIGHFLARLLADHSGHPLLKCTHAVDQDAIQKLLAEESNHPEKILREFPDNGSSSEFSTLRLFADPKNPTADERLFGVWSAFLSKLSRKLHLPQIRWDLFLTVVAVIGLAWIAATRPDIYSEQTLRNYTSELTNFIPLPIAIIAVFTIGGLLFVPINLLIVASATVVNGPLGVASILAATVVNACVTYGAGRFLGPRILSKELVGKSQRIIKKLRLSGIRTIIVIRLVPTVPNSVLNIAAGVSRINFTNFIIGTTIGVMPGVIILVYLQQSLIDLVRNFSTFNLIVLIFTALLIFFLGRFFQRKFLIHARNPEN